MCNKTEMLRFLDIKNYIAPGFSYDKFIKAYDVSQTKFFFPYEYVDSLEKLNHSLPSHEAFYSNLKKNQHLARRLSSSSQKMAGGELDIPS